MKPPSTRSPKQDLPTRRPLQIFASDPMRGPLIGGRVSVDVPNEPLRPGPQGSRIEVIDYDTERECYYAPVDLDDPAILMQGGLAPSESDPRFHQQMVYAVAMRVVENFERALGRRLHLGREPYTRLRLLPHAFTGANAYYDPALHAVLFGHFQADVANPGPNLPGQSVFTCLSHDIIAHEVTHALVHKLRRYFLEPTNQDVLAFHEGFADVVALFQHFSFQDILETEIQRTRSDLRQPTLLVELAQQFGYASGMGAALRTGLDAPDPQKYQKEWEPHTRGAILVGAVFDAFFAVYQRRISDLTRIASGGTGQLPGGDLHPDLVRRIAREASKTAQSILTMCVRAFDYLPPVDVTFGDYLRALVTADYELVPVDEVGQRTAVIEAFRLRGIYPEQVRSLAEESLLWERVPANALSRFPIALVGDLVMAAQSLRQPRGSRNGMSRDLGGAAARSSRDGVSRTVARQAHRWATANARVLGLATGLKVAVHGFHPVFRVAPSGQLQIELIAQFVQTDRTRGPEFGGVPLRGGTTVVAGADGTIRYVIAKPLPSSRLSADQRRAANLRVERQQEFVAASDRDDARLAWGDRAYLRDRSRRRAALQAVHQGVVR